MDDDGVMLTIGEHPRATGWARIYWTLRCYWNAATWRIRKLWLSEKIEIDSTNRGSLKILNSATNRRPE